ncbi:polysaccharide deacetylase family protein [Sulfitobacter noctilucae]|uniref:polysaccharide deacetylase family protein n=1 Tax=Sulfitobacter noctilucae TaxID=1342302 RepID=UPI000469AC17|nr:polysaccharide deacetylase family protein [Sulfitobacter noctilucae]
MRLPIWWRDDDAIAPTPELDRLTRMAGDLYLPVHLAVIPEPATSALASYCAGAEMLIPLVHGWRHKNHAPESAKKAEFAHPRSGIEGELKAALARMKTLFSANMVPVFVPPWNRLDPSIMEKVALEGYRGVSTFTPRTSKFAAAGLVQINTHLDPINWRGGGGLVAEDVLIDRLVTLLRDRREGRTDLEEPLGLLTHHLVHDAAIWDFTRTCLSRLLDGGAVAVDLRLGPLP